MNASTPRYADYLTHTQLCRQAVGTPLDYAHAAIAAGLPEIACTDHGPTPVGFGVEHRLRLGPRRPR